MKILITNDDGVESVSLLMLFDALKQDHDVWVMAPHHEKSASSHSITMRGPMVVREKGERLYSCTGTPADCALVALKGYFDFEFDLVLSGINKGPNLGSDIIYSGTAAGARQAAMMGVPSVALSQCLDGKIKPDYTLAVEWVKKNLQSLISVWTSSCFLNVNFPVSMDHQSETEFCIPGTRIYRDKLEILKAPDNGVYCFFTYGGKPECQADPETDTYLSEQGKITLSAIKILPHASILPEDQRTVFKSIKERA